jgi:nucleotide-binding universal stress UspA family protein
MRILLAVDGSPNSLDAVTTLVKHLDWFRDKPEVRLIYVHLPVPKIGGMSSVISKESLDRYYREEGAQALAKARKLLEDAGVKFNAEVLVGRPAETIVAEADKVGCDLIYIGTRGLDAVSNVVIGSVATKVLHLAKTPVILVK